MHELEVISLTYQASLYLIQRIESLPRFLRFSLGQTVMVRMNDILERLIRAKYATATDKVGILGEVNLELELLRFQIRQLSDLRGFGHASQEHVFRLLLQIGQQVGGWLRHLRSKQGTGTS